MCEIHAKCMFFRSLFTTRVSPFFERYSWSQRSFAGIQQSRIVFVVFLYFEQNAGHISMFCRRAEPVPRKVTTISFSSTSSTTLCPGWFAKKSLFASIAFVVAFLSAFFLLVFLRNSASFACFFAELNGRLHIRHSTFVYTHRSLRQKRKLQ